MVPVINPAKGINQSSSQFVVDSEALAVSMESAVLRESNGFVTSITSTAFLAICPIVAMRNTRAYSIQRFALYFTSNVSLSLPESVGFWKSRLEEGDADQTFAVGLLYGPSGCGKSSMMKAGLLPRLSPDVVVIYLEATVDDTERTLLAMIRKKLASTDAELTKSLVDLLYVFTVGKRQGKRILKCCEAK